MTMFEKALSYFGNYNLKPEKIQIEWSPEMLQEWMKCANDPVHFIEQYMKVHNADGELVPLILYPYQREMILSMWKNQNSIFATARQAGKSTTVCAFILWYVIFNQGKVVALLANKLDVAQEMMAKIKLGYELLPSWLQHGVKKWNERSILLENGSRVIAGATSKDTIRGFTVNLLFIDEVAHVEQWPAFFTSVFNTISQGKKSKIVMVSTPLGLNHFWAFWTNALKKLNDYYPVLVTWKDVPGRDEAWKQKMLAASNFDHEKFAQEQEVQFLGSSGTLIAGWKLKELVAQIPLTERGSLIQYKKPVPDHRYTLVADVSEGRAKDYSAFSIIDITQMPYEQVSVYRDNLVLPVDYGDVIHRIAKTYNEALVLVETNNIGEAIADRLYYEYEYVNLVQTESAGAQGKRISLGFAGKRTDRGIRTTKRVKNIGCSILKMLIEQNQLIINDAETIYELSTFSKKNDSYQAEAGKHDDIAMGLVLFAWMTDQNYFKEFSDINTLNLLRERTDEEIMAELTPFGIITDGQDVEETPTIDGDVDPALTDTLV